MYRQGDVLLVRESSLPTHAKPAKHSKGPVVLAEGEITGHLHAFHDADAVTEYLAPAGFHTPSRREYTPERRYIKVHQLTQLEHPEHRAIDLSPGIYRVVTQREFDADRHSRPVYD